jgi:twitching motility protein PilT
LKFPAIANVVTNHLLQDIEDRRRQRVQAKPAEKNIIRKPINAKSLARSCRIRLFDDQRDIDQPRILGSPLSGDCAEALEIFRTDAINRRYAFSAASRGRFRQIPVWRNRRSAKQMIAQTKQDHLIAGEISRPVHRVPVSFLLFLNRKANAFAQRAHFHRFLFQCRDSGKPLEVLIIRTIEIIPNGLVIARLDDDTDLLDAGRDQIAQMIVNEGTIDSIRTHDGKQFLFDGMRCWKMPRPQPRRGNHRLANRPHHAGYLADPCELGNTVLETRAERRRLNCGISGAHMDFPMLLKFAADREASDIHLQTGLSPKLRIQGVLHTVDQPVLTDEEIRQFVGSIAPVRMRDKLDDRMMVGMDFSYAAPGICRFRCSAYRTLGTSGISLRLIKSKIPGLAELHLPAVISDIAMSGRGLTLVTGTTGSGKSTTLAAMIELINSSRPTKIISIEDPVEYLHVPKQALIAQLEVGMDTPSFEQALRQALRQDPDVVLVGELRDMDTLRIALRAADTGHQVFSTVHSASAPQTIERIIAMFPPSEHKLLLTQLAGNLEAIVSQRLVIARDGKRRPAAEVLRGGPVTQKYILDGKALELGDYIKSGGSGQQTFDQDLISLFKQELISHAEALRNATNREAMEMMMRGIGASKPQNEQAGAAASRPKPISPQNRPA